jgi:hypothetical protein
MPIRWSVLAMPTCLIATLLVGCADGGSSVTHAAGAVPVTPQGIDASVQGSPGRSVHSGVRRTLAVPTCSGAGGYSFVGGSGGLNINIAGGSYSVVGGGEGNQACDSWSTIAGGYFNAVSHGTSSNPYDSFIGGGESNIITGNDSDSAIVGGNSNSVSNAESAIVAGETNSVVARDSLVGAGETNAINNLKTDVAQLDDAAVLAKVAALPIERWSYKSERGVRHVGPMAQDFYAAFGVGEDDKHITSIDEDGVALAAIKALHARVGELHAQNADAHTATNALRAQNARLTALTATQSSQIANLSAEVASIRASVRAGR